MTHKDIAIAVLSSLNWNCRIRILQHIVSGVLLSCSTGRCMNLHMYMLYNLYNMCLKTPLTHGRILKEHKGHSNGTYRYTNIRGMLQHAP